jgi:hypothetical protein
VADRLHPLSAMDTALSPTVGQIVGSDSTLTFARRCYVLAVVGTTIAAHGEPDPARRLERLRFIHYSTHTP